MAKQYIYTGHEIVDKDDIEHWKYLKREKVNGKWRYYYNDPEYQKAKNANTAAQKDLNNKAWQAGAAGAKSKDAREQYLKKHGYAVGGSPSSKEEKSDWDRMKKAQNDYLSRLDKLEAAKKKAEKTSKKYQKVKLKTLPRRAIAKGAASIANLLSRKSK